MPEVAWLLRKARIEDSEPPYDIAIDNGHIVAIEHELAVYARDTWDLSGLVVLPGLINAHVHLDKTYGPGENGSGTLDEATKVWESEKDNLSFENYLVRAKRAARKALASGTTALRTHVDIDSSGLNTALEAILELRESYKGLLDIQIVAMGQAGATPKAVRALEQALELGADIIGGTPARCADPQACIDASLDLALAYGKPVDLHIDETTNPEVLTLKYLAEQTIERGLQGYVTAGHCSSLDFVGGLMAEQVIDKVLEAELNIVTLPSSNLVLLGRDQHPVPRGLTRVKTLLRRGVNVAAASDNVQDPFNPLGSYNLLSLGNICAHAAHLNTSSEIQDCLEMITTRPAGILGLENYGLFEGAKADLCVLNARRVAHTIPDVPHVLATFKDGRVVVRSEMQTRWTELMSRWS